MTKQKKSLITREVVIAAAESKHYKEVMTRILEQPRAHVSIAIELAVPIAEKFDDHVGALFLSWHGPSATITEEVFKAAARNKESGAKVIALLLARLGAGVTITEEVFKAAAGNEGSCKKMMTLLLDRPGAGLMITEVVVMAAAKNHNNGQELLKLLLEEQGEYFPVSEKVVSTVVQDFGGDTAVLLFRQRGSDIRLTDNLFNLVFTKDRSDRSAAMMRLLLEWREGR
jgi:hypothetical protein